MKRVDRFLRRYSLWCLLAAVLPAIFGGYLSDRLRPSIAVLNGPDHAFAVLILTVLAWLLKFLGLLGMGVVLITACLPILYFFFWLVEDRLIPGPLDDWIAAAYEPIKQQVSKAAILSTLKWSGVICLIIGGSLLGSNTYLSPYGFIFLASSSGQYLVASIIMRDWQQVVLFGTTFVLVDCLGVYRWLVAS